MARTARPRFPASLPGAVLGALFAVLLPGGHAAPAAAEDLPPPVLRIAVLSIVDHPGFAAMRLGLADRLLEAQATLDGRVIVEKISAEADLARLEAEARRLAQGDARLLVALSAPAARALAGQQTKKPVVFAAAGAEEAGAILGGRKAATVIGIVERPPEGERLDLVRRILPAVRRLIVPYEAARAGAAEGARAVAGLAGARGFGPVLRPITGPDGDPLAGVSGTATALFLVPALMSAGMLDAVLASAELQALPAIGGDARTVAGGALATVVHDAYATGRAVGEAALGLLAASPGQAGAVPASQASGLREAVAGHVVINLDSATRLGHALPADLLESAGTRIDSADGDQPRPAAKPAAPAARRRGGAE